VTHFSRDNPPAARIGQRSVIVPLLAPRPAWLVFDSPDPAIEGPFDVVAIAYQQTWLEAEASVDDRGAEQTRRFYASAEVEAYHGAELEREISALQLSFIILPADAGDWETLAIEQKYVFFGEEAARAALEERRKHPIPVEGPIRDATRGPEA